MPLMKSKSKKAFEHNLKAELHEGKPKDQSLAIAYSIKRKAPKKMADGGKVDISAKDEHHVSVDSLTAEEMDMIKEFRKGMSEGGMVDLGENAEEDSGYGDELNMEALGKEIYDESGALEELDSPLDSNEHGDEREKAAEDKHDRIDAIRSKMKSKKRI